MIKKIGKLCALLLAAVQMLITPCFAEDPVNSTVYILTLEDAIGTAISNNEQLVACQVKKEAAETSVSVAKSEQRAAKKSPFVINELIYVKNGYAVAAQEMQVRLAEAELKQITNRISYQVTEKYFNIKLAQQLVLIHQNGVEMAKENMQIVSTQFALGMVSELEVSNAEIQVKRTTLALEDAIRALALAKEDFKITLGITDPCDFSLTDSITYEDYSFDVTADIASAMNTRYDVMSLRELAKLDELYFTITQKITAENTADYQNAESTHLQSHYNYETNSKLIGLSIRAAYNNIASQKGNLEIAQLALNVKQREYDTAKLKFEMGMITNLELVKTQTELLQCQTELENAKLSYKLAVEKYRYEITYGV